MSAYKNTPSLQHFIKNHRPCPKRALTWRRQNAHTSEDEGSRENNRHTARILTVYVSNLVLLEDSLGLLDHVSFGFTLRPVEQRLLQLTLQQLHETMGVCVVVDAAANRTEAHGNTMSGRGPLHKQNAPF